LRERSSEEEREGEVTVTRRFKRTQNIIDTKTKFWRAFDFENFSLFLDLRDKIHLQAKCKSCRNFAELWFSPPPPLSVSSPFWPFSPPPLLLTKGDRRKESEKQDWNCCCCCCCCFPTEIRFFRLEKGISSVRYKEEQG
jgi:hypothetical protein